MPDPAPQGAVPPEPARRSGAAGVAGVVVVLGVALAGLGHALATRSTRTHAPGSLDGAQLYAQYCARCHGLDLRGDERAPSLLARAVPDDELALLLREGRQGMPAFRGALDAEDVARLGSHLAAARAQAEAGRRGPAGAPVPGR